MPNGEVTIGEMVRVVQAFKEDVREDLRAINGRLDNLNMVHVDVYAADRTADAENRRAMGERLGALESRERETTTWALRYLLALIVTILLAVGSTAYTIIR